MIRKPGGESYPAAGRQAGQFILQEQFEQPIEFRFVHIQLGQRFRNVVLDPNIFGRKILIELFKRLADHLV